MKQESEFQIVDYDKFPCLKIAFDVLKEGGNIPCIMNGADDACVNLFMEEKIGFTDIPKIVLETINSYNKSEAPNIDELVALDEEIHKKLYERFYQK